MKQLFMFLVSALFPIVYGCSPKAEESSVVAAKYKVGVFYGHGASQTCSWEAQAAAALNGDFEVIPVASRDLAEGVLEELDALVIPGGGGSTEFVNLGSGNHQRIQQFVKNGGGIVGVCAGAYLLSATPEYSCLDMACAQAIDIEHDNRGRGVAKVCLSEQGKAFFPEVAEQDTLYLMYYEGPVIVPRDTDETPVYETSAVMQSDVHVEGNAPENMTNDKPFYYLNTYGQGKVFSIVGHPEATPGMQWMLARCIELVLPLKDGEERELYVYNEEVVQPGKFNKEILMDKDRRAEESKIFQQFLYGSVEEKKAGLLWCRDHLSWSGKRWLQGFLFDAHPELRLLAAETILWNLYGYYLEDLYAAANAEQDPELKQKLERIAETLDSYYYSSPVGKLKD